MNRLRTESVSLAPADAGRRRPGRGGAACRAHLRPVQEQGLTRRATAAGATVFTVEPGRHAADPRVADADDVSLEARIAAQGALVVLADAADERIGGWLLDGCAVLPRHAEDAQIEAALAALDAGLVATPPAFASAALRYERLGEVTARPSRGVLTPRERDVLAGMTEGSSNRVIAVQLGISPHTAKFHVAQIIAKLGARSRAQAVAKALRAGMLDAG